MNAATARHHAKMIMLRPRPGNDNQVHFNQAARGCNAHHALATTIKGTSAKPREGCDVRFIRQSRTTQLSSGGGHGEYELPETKMAPAVCCSAWFG